MTREEQSIRLTGQADQVAATIYEWVGIVAKDNAATKTAVLAELATAAEVMRDAPEEFQGFPDGLRKIVVAALTLGLCNFEERYRDELIESEADDER